MTRPALIAAALLLSSTPALAAQNPDLTLNLTPPSGVHVYETGRYWLRVRNTGNKNAATVVLTIQLPRTHTSPQVYILGTLGPRDGRCTLSGTALTCGLGTINKNNAYTDVFFDIALPYSTAPLVISGVVRTATPEPDQNDNSASHTAAPLTYPTPVVPTVGAINRHCTGTSLTSFMECEYFPSSISSHEILLEPAGVLSFPGISGYSGIWTQTGDRLQFSYYEGLDKVAEFDGRGVGNDCFEGPTHFFPASVYMSIYEVCLQ